MSSSVAELLLRAPSPEPRVSVFDLLRCLRGRVDDLQPSLRVIVDRHWRGDVEGCATASHRGEFLSAVVALELNPDDLDTAEADALESLAKLAAAKRLSVVTRLANEDQEQGAANMRAVWAALVDLAAASTADNANKAIELCGRRPFGRSVLDEEDAERAVKELARYARPLRSVALAEASGRWAGVFAPAHRGGAGAPSRSPQVSYKSSGPETKVPPGPGATATPAFEAESKPARARRGQVWITVGEKGRLMARGETLSWPKGSRRGYATKANREGVCLRELAGGSCEEADKTVTSHLRTAFGAINVTVNVAKKKNGEVILTCTPRLRSKVWG